MDYNEKLGLLERGLQRRVDEMPSYREHLENEAKKVEAVVEQYKKIIEDYKYDEKIRKELLKDERLILIAGSKAKLNKLIKDEAKFVATVELGMEEYQKNYGVEAKRFRKIIEEAEESLDQVKELLRLIKTNEVCHTTLKLMLDLFFKDALSDWKAVEDKKREEVEAQDEKPLL